MDNLWQSTPESPQLTNDEPQRPLMKVQTNGTLGRHVRNESEATTGAKEYAGCSPMEARPGTPGRPTTPGNLSSNQSKEGLKGQREPARPSSRMTIGADGDVAERSLTPQNSGRPLIKQQSSASSLQARMGGVTRRLSQMNIGKKGSKNSVKAPTMGSFKEG